MINIHGLVFEMIFTPANPLFSRIAVWGELLNSEFNQNYTHTSIEQDDLPIGMEFIGILQKTYSKIEYTSFRG